jgi:hypothetical protein
MKTTIEVHGYEITIDEMEDKVMVSAVKDGETVEEFELEVEGGEGMDDFEGGEEQDFDDFEGGEDEMEGGDEMEGDDEMEDEMEDEEGKTLESFAHFVKNRRK